jgi:hypothetical protein
MQVRGMTSSSLPFAMAVELLVSLQAKNLSLFILPRFVDLS